jgi:phage gpG-like protein
MLAFRQLEDTATPLMERIGGMLSGDIRSGCESAAAEKFKEIALANLGFPPGRDRPEVWADLSDSPMGLKYQKKVGRSIATLFETGAMAKSVQIGVSEGTEVVCLSEYGAKHQFGDSEKSLPARPFFPMDENEVITPQSERECLDAAQQQLDEMLNKL